jgi:hypothetical protein
LESVLPPPRARILEEVYNNAEDRATVSWDARRTHYKAWLGITIKGTEWERFFVLVNLRNAVAHGVGQLTRRQARKNQVQLVSDFASVGVALKGTHIEFLNGAVRTCAGVASTFIKRLDLDLSALAPKMILPPPS